MAKNDTATKAASKEDASKKGEGTVTVRLVKGLRGTQARHRLSVKALGLGKLNSVRVLKDSPQVRGLINQLHYLVKVED
ncbi:MAG: 50S ribosomal protein L30 [Thermomonas sp.]